MIDQSRRRRIAAGAGVEPHEVNELVKQFDGMADMMKRMSGMGIRDRMRTMQELAQGGMLESRREAGQAEGRHRQTADPAGAGQAEERARERRCGARNATSDEASDERIARWQISRRPCHEITVPQITADSTNQAQTLRRRNAWQYVFG